MGDFFSLKVELVLRALLRGRIALGVDVGDGDEFVALQVAGQVPNFRLDQTCVLQKILSAARRRQQHYEVPKDK
jgi:hypothetical protein